jgi:TRAP-type C4-dicarboxylate transport system substrate-binding protein
MLNLKRLLIVAAAGLLLGVKPLTAALEIKLATQAPPLTAWTNALGEMGATWAKDTEGRVTLTVFPGGVMGSEKTVLQKMRPGVETLQATFITSGGLGEIDKAFNVFGIPFFFETDAEQLAVQTKLTPVLSERLNAKGYQLICWGTGGWIQVFSKKPLKSVADVKAAKLYAAKDDEEMLQWYVSNGFHPVGLTIADIVPQLKLSTGMIDTAPNPPYLAQMTGVYQNAPYMLDLHIAPLTGALIMSKTAWAKISKDDQAKVLAASAATEKKIRDAAPGLDASSIKAMSARGLNVISLDAKAMSEFRTEAAKLGTSMRGSMVPIDIYDAALAERDAVRKKK